MKVYALYGDLNNVKSCEDWKQIKASLVGTYVAGAGEEVALKDLSRLGLSERPLTFNVVTTKVTVSAALQDTTGCKCATCGQLSCCPANGKCIGCADCGDACCGIKEGGGGFETESGNQQ